MEIGKEESEIDFDVDEKHLFDQWNREIQLAQKEQDDWIKICKKITEVYTRSKDGKLHDPLTGAPAYGMLWSHVRTIAPALYSSTPKPAIERRNKDSDPVGRLAAEILSRTISFVLEEESFDDTARMGRDDYILYARGVSWIRYDPTIEEIEIEGIDGIPIKAPQIVRERARIDYINYKDFLTSPARYWQEVRWVSKLVYMTKKQLVDRFGQRGKEAKLTYVSESAKERYKSEEKTETFKRAKVFEIWDKESKRVYWLTEGLPDKFLDIKDDPLSLEGFFPCARPLFDTLANDSTVPIPEFCIWGDMARELDRLTRQIFHLTRALKVVGVRNAAVPELDRLFNEALDTELIPVKDWISFQEGSGGIKNAMELVPLDGVIDALARLYDSRRQLEETIYRVNGNSDLIRGSSDPSETATAQQIKGQFATLRLRDRQAAVQRWCKETISILAEVIAEHFQDSTIFEMAGVSGMGEDAVRMFPDAVQLLRNDARRRFRIDIETDSTIAIDQDTDKQRRIEFADTMSNLVQKVGPMIQGAPALAPFLGEVVTFVARGLNAGRQLEGALENALRVMSQPQPEAEGPPPPDPKLIELQQKNQLKQMEIQSSAALKEQEIQARTFVQREKNQADREFQERKLETEVALEAQKAQVNLQLSAAKLQGEQAYRERQSLARRIQERHDPI